MPIEVFEQATRDQVWLRGFFMGPSGSGKSRGALELASRLFGGELPIVLINTEANRGRLYADRFTYGLVELMEDYHPHRFVEALDVAEGMVKGGVCVLDSATHEWYGNNGINQLAGRFNDWSKARPLHQEFVDRMTVMQCHLIVCCRAKMKYDVAEVEDNGRKKQVITMLGVGPMQDGDLQYEFSLVARFEQKTHEAEFSGHIDALDGVTSQMVGEHADAIAEKVTEWCSKGDPVVPPEAAAEKDIAKLVGLLNAEGFTDDVIEGKFAIKRRENRGQLHPTYVAEQIEKAEERAKAAKKKPEAGQEPAQEPAGGPRAEGPPEPSEGEQATLEGAGAPA